MLPSNLLNNAAKFSPDHLPIRISASLTKTVATICVSDEGDGIAPDMLGRIFEMFEQEPQGEGRRREGLGIGLTLVKLLVEAHGGTVRAQSDGPGRGSQFSFTLPLDS